MSLISTELDLIQERLHDNGTVWSRTELLRWFNDGYQAMVAGAGAVRRFRCFEVPPRTGWAVTQEWEARHAAGTFRKFTKTSNAGNYQCTFEWEVEHLEGVSSPTNSAGCVTQLWELQYLGATIDDHYRFYLPKSHERILRVAFDDKRMFGTSSKELDKMDAKWWQHEGEPSLWLMGLDRDRSFETYEIESTYQQAYSLIDNLWGTARLFSGDRTYDTIPAVVANDYAYATAADSGYLTGLGWRFTFHDNTTDFDCTFEWEKEMLEGETTFTAATYGAFTYAWETEFLGLDIQSFAVGTVRAISSPDRQYIPMAYDTGELALYGTVREFQSSADAISVLETIFHTRDLDENDAPGLVPERLTKYIRCYVWAMAFGREGEGQRLDMAKHYLDRFDAGVQFFKTLGDLTARDRVYQRSVEALNVRREPGFPRLPATYPSLGR